MNDQQHARVILIKNIADEIRYVGGRLNEGIDPETNSVRRRAMLDDLNIDWAEFWGMWKQYRHNAKQALKRTILIQTALNELSNNELIYYTEKYNIVEHVLWWKRPEHSFQQK